jgi:hypothetical protein
MKCPGIALRITDGWLAIGILISLFMFYPPSETSYVYIVLLYY